MTISTHDYTAQLVTSVRIIDVPAHDEPVPATTLYSQDFESFATAPAPVLTPDGWTLTSPATATAAAFGYGSAVAHRGVGSMALDAGTATTARVNISRRITGLTPGRTYSVSAWVRPMFAATVTLSAYGYGNDGNASASQAIAAGDAAQLVTTRFVPSAVSAIVSFTFVLTAAQLGIVAYVDDITFVENARVDRIPDHYADPTMFPLSVVDGRMRLDEGSQPFLAGELIVSRPSQARLAQMNPVNNPRVLLTATETNMGYPGNVRTFNCGVRSWSINHVDDTVTLGLASDDVLLQDDKLISKTPDTSNLARQSSVRSIAAFMVNHAAGAAIAPGTADADFTVLSALTNYMPNGNFETGTDGWTTSMSTKTWSDAWSRSGIRSIAIAGSVTTNSGSYVSCPVALSPGATYTLTGYIRLASPLTGTLSSATRQARVIAVVGGGNVAVAETSPVPNVAGATKISLTFTVPGNATDVAIRLQNGSAQGGGTVWYDALMIVEGDGQETDGVNPLAYFDGDTPSNANYGYAWTGTPRLSPSTRTPVFERSIDTLTWNPGESAWQFLEAILDQAGLRLFCDETRTWQLVNNDYNPPGLVTIAEGFNLYTASDTISRDATAVDGSPLFIDAALVKYTWTDRRGVDQTRYDAYSLPGAKSSYLFEVNRPYPGPGAAKYAVTRNNGRAHALDVTGRQDWSVTPSQQVSATLPGSDAQIGYVSAVEWSLGADDMAIFTRGLIQTPPTAWFFEAPGLSWDALPAGSSWANG